MAKKNKKNKEEQEAAQEDSLTSKIKNLLEENPQGMTADQIALALEIYKEDSPVGVKRVELKKVRIHARKATEGVEQKKMGRTAVYHLGEGDPEIAIGKEEDNRDEEE